MTSPSPPSSPALLLDDDMVSGRGLEEIDTAGTGFKREACDPPQSAVLACTKNPLRRHDGWNANASDH
ncbi:unnamed protein product [Musa acuminata var. zebrina]